jgi:gliding motility-associated-like protein
VDSGRYDIPLIAANGCDSTVHLSLGFYPPIDEYLYDTTCDNVPYHIAGNTYTDSGQYDIKFIAHNGCDSMLHLNLSLLPHYEAHHYDTLCYGNGLEFYGVVYTNTGTYVHPLQTVQGCDSLIMLHLSAMAKDLKAAMQINPRIVTLDNLEFNLYNTSHHSSYGIWSIDDRTYTERALSMHYPTEYDSLPVTLVAYSPEGCTDTVRATVTIDRSHITTPNVFTPNQEINNVWCVAKHEILTTELWIYTRAGNLVKHIGVGEEPCWDGTFEGEACPQGTYVYTLLYTTESRPDRVQKQLGTILLLR